MAGRVITASSEAELLRQSGAAFVDELRVDASDANAPDDIRRDWGVVARWLGYNSGELTPAQRLKLEKAWLAYFALGVAPSENLQIAFTLFAKKAAGVDKNDRAPSDVMDVFDRLLATDDEIIAKRAADLRRTEAELRPFLNKTHRKGRSGWWRRQPVLVRRWVFGTVVWVAVVVLIAAFFDPFNVGGWDRMYREELIRLCLIALAPLGAGGAFYAYRKWVQ